MAGAVDVMHLHRRDPARSMFRFYRLHVVRDLFGGVALLREWGRIGSPGRVRLDPHADEGAALAAAKRLLRAKLRRGYQAVSSAATRAESSLTALTITAVSTS
jgi:predicted DNA-binding WGR domain protein